MASSCAGRGRVESEAIVVEGYASVSVGVAAWRVSSSHER